MKTPWYLSLFSSVCFAPPGEGGNQDTPPDDDDNNPDDPVTNRRGQFREPTEYERRLRTEAASHRRARREAETRLKEAEASWATKEQTIREEAQAAARQQADQRVINAEVKVIAKELGIIDVDGLKLADLSKVKLDDKGEVVGAKEALEALKESKPFLFKEQKDSGNNKPTPKPGEGSPKSALSMSPEEYKAEKAKLGIK